MIRRKGFILSTMMVITMAASASASAESVEFSPEKGEVRSYQLFSHGLIRSEYSRDGHPQALETDAVLSYEVLEAGQTLSLAITPRYLQQSVDGMQGLSSMESPDRQSPVILELMSAGFEVDINRDSGEVLSFTNRNKDLWLTLQEDGLDGLDELLKGFEQQMTTGMAVSPIPLVEGEVITMAGPKSASEIRVTVQSVTDAEVVTTLQMDNAEVKWAGTMVLERETGWLRRLALVSEVQLDAREERGSLRQVLVMLPENEPSWLGAWLTDLVANGLEDFAGIQPGPSPVEFDDVEVIDRDNLLDAPVGTRVSVDNELLLEITHGLSKGAFPGYLDFADLRIESEEGDVIDVGLQRTTRFTFYHPELRRHKTMAWYVPLGWGAELAPLERTERLTAKGVTYQPVVAEALTLPLNKDYTTEVASGDIYAKAIPLDSPGEFLVRFHSTQDHWFSNRIYGVNETISRRAASESAADWLTAHEAWILDVVALGRASIGDLHIQFEEGNVPDDVTLFALSESEPVSFDVSVPFVSEEARHSDIDLPPSVVWPLYSDGEEPALVPLGELELPSVENNHVQHTLPTPLAAMCELIVVDAPEINHQPLVWQRSDESDTYDQGRSRLEQDWKVSTQDGVRDHFYGMELESEIQCPGQGEWREIDIDLGSQDWLVNLDDLPDAVDPEQGIIHFLQRYRFIGEQGDALAPMPRERYSDVSLATSSLADYINDGNRLRLAGHIQRVERFEVIGQPEVRRWSLRYAPLP